MLKQSFLQFLKWPLILLLALSFIGAAFDLGWLVFSLALSGFFLWNLWQQRKLYNWLCDPELRSPPDATGMWGDLFDRLYVMQKKHRQEVESLKKTISRVQKSAQSLRDGVIMINASDEIEWWNKSAKKMIGLKEEDRGQVVTNLLREPKFVAFFESGTHLDPITLPSPKSREQLLQIHASKYNINEKLLLIRDVTRIRQLEQMRQDFVSNASHELRTPLTVLTGYLETFLDQEEMVPKPMQRGLKQMQNQTVRMNHLVEDLLLLTRLDSDTHNRQEEWIALKPLVASIMVDGQDLSAQKEHQFSLTIPEDLFIKGQENELRSAFSNLVFNAVHYTPAGGKIDIHWQFIGKQGCFCVQDNGIGIDPRHIPRLTERFYRVDVSRSSATGGTGLGLAIVKHVLQLHQAKLDIQSQLGKGSLFSCLFESARIRVGKETQSA